MAEGTITEAQTSNVEPEKDEDEENKKTRHGVYIQTPVELRERLEQEAEAVGKSPAAYVRDMLAAQWGITLPEARTRTVYKSPEDKKAAQTKKRQDRQALIKALLAEHEAKMKAAAEANGVAHTADNQGETVAAAA